MKMIDMYKEVFKDCVECYFDNGGIELTDEEKNYIVDRLIYKSEYMWEAIDEAIESTYQFMKKNK